MSHEPISSGNINPRDVLDIDALLDDEERLLRDTVRSFVADRVLPHVADWFEAGTFPREMATEMGALGLLGMHLKGYGCAGTSAVAYGLACLELEAGHIHSTLLPHGPLETLGLVFIERSTGKKAVYFTDCKEVHPDQREMAKGADVVILDALQQRKHPTHMSIDEAVETAQDIGAQQTFFIHMAFLVDHETVDRELPEGISLAYDGLRLQL